MDSNEFNIKFHARQAFTIFKNKNLKAKRVNCNANIYFIEISYVMLSKLNILRFKLF
jgi:hypothetical protein